MRQHAVPLRGEGPSSHNADRSRFGGPPTEALKRKSPASFQFETLAHDCYRGNEEWRAMITVPELAAEALSSFLASHMNRRFGSMLAGLIERISSVARLALECIGNSDALYHTVEHTMLVTLVGYDIMNGRALLRPTHPSDYAHLILACLFHDIGFVRGILNGDEADGYVIDANGRKAKLPRGSSDAALLPYHVDRSKLYVLDRLAGNDLFDAERVADAIEFTRFPPAGSDN